MIPARSASWAMVSFDDRLAEVGLRGGRDPVGVLAEVDQVHVVGQDPLLGLVVASFCAMKISLTFRLAVCWVPTPS